MPSNIIAHCSTVGAHQQFLDHESQSRLTNPRAVAMSVLLSLAALHLLRWGASFFPPTVRLWGINDLTYFSPPTQIAVTVMALLLLIPRIDVLIASAASSLWGILKRLLPSTPALGNVLWSVLAVIVFWQFRVSTFLLGDGQVLINDALNVKFVRGVIDMMGLASQTHTPVATLIYFVAVQLGDLLFGMSVPHTFQAVACLAGGLYVFAVLQFVQWFFSESSSRILGGTLLLFHGASLFYFGYIEYYPLFHLSTFAYCGSALRVLSTRKGLAWPAVFLLLTIGLHFIGVVLVPSFLLLLLYYVAGSKRIQSRLTWKMILLGLGCSALILIVAYYFSGEYEVRQHFLPVTSLDVEMHYTLVSIPHLLDYLNVLFLVSAPALVLILPLLISDLRNTQGPQIELKFCLLVLCFQQAFVFTANPDLGFARDWDLAGAMNSGLILMVICLWKQLSGMEITKRLAAPIASAAVMTTLPWISLNHHEIRSVERFENLIEMDTKMVGDYRTAYGFEMLAIHFRNQNDHERERSYLGLAAKASKNIRFYENLLISFERNGVTQGDAEVLLRVVERFRQEVTIEKNLRSGEQYFDHLNLFYVGARILRELGYCSKAQAQYQQAIEADLPNLGYAYLGLGRCAQDAGETSRAALYYERVHPSHLSVVKSDKENAARLFFSVKRYDSAIAWYRSLQGDTGLLDEESLYSLCSSYIEIHDLSQATTLFNDYRKAYPQGKFQQEIERMITELRLEN